MIPRGSSCHGCPLWAFQCAIKYSVGISIPWEHDVVHGWLNVTSYRPNPIDSSAPSLFGERWKKLCCGPGKQLDRTPDIPGAMGWVQKTLAPDQASACSTNGGLASPSLVPSEIPFLSSGQILDPSVSRQNLFLPWTCTLLKWRQTRLQIFMLINRSIGKMLVKSLR